MKELKLTVNPQKTKSHINREIYGHFSEHLGRCIYEGIYVGEDSPIPNKKGIRTDVFEALKNIRIPVLRWPGGCFADEYHWKDGIGDKSSRKKMVNTNWGGVVEDNSFGTHEFMDLCEELGCEPYVSGNLGSGTVQEMAEWIEYMTFDGISPMAELRRKNGREKPWKLKYFGIGNESWGCGGNMRPEFYSDKYKQYQCFCKNYSGNQLYKVACGPSDKDYNWTEVLLSNVTSQQTQAISLHYYTVPTGNWSHKGAATVFEDSEYYATIAKTLFMEEIVTKHSEVMDRHDPEKKIGLIVDEWGCWYDVEEGTNPGFLYQQNTMRDAIVAAINLNIFNEHSDRVVMANIAQVINVLQAVILTEGERMVLTPTYHVFDLYKEHQDAELLESSIENFITGTGSDRFNAVSKSVSKDKDGNVLITLSNASLDEDAKVVCDLGEFGFSKAEGRIICADDPRDFNDFDKDPKVFPKDLAAETENGSLVISLPACSVVSVRLFK
ncbi:MAG: alpha-N-arabinofuranosidase [Ruminococcus sp.]|nr:alpha-N-arabinofuranosidase [Ruminococcus sp.]